MNIVNFEQLFSCTGYTVSYGRAGDEIMQVNLEVDKRFVLKCPLCGSKMSLNRSKYSFARDLPFGPIKDVFIKFPTRQGRCYSCDSTHTFKPETISHTARATKRLMFKATAFCSHMPVRKIAEYFNVSHGTIRSWNQKCLGEILGKVNFDNLRYILVDEKSIGKGHSYVTVVLNAINGDLLHMAPGRKKDSLKQFIDKLSNAQKSRIMAVCVDRSGSYTSCLSEFLPNAQIVYDKFHLVKNLNDVIDLVRRKCWNETRQNGDSLGATLIKGQRYNLLRNKANNTQSQQRRLDELLRVNAPLNEAYVLLDSFKYILSTSNSSDIENNLKTWISMASNSCRKEMVRFAKNLKPGMDRIANAIKFKINNGPIESFNRKIAMVIRRSCGCKNLNYLFLNLRQLARKPIPL